MKNDATFRRLSAYNSIIKQNDEIYHGVAKALGLPDCAFWILYLLRESSGVLTQSDICNDFYQPKQTVNSALKKLESEGFIVLQNCEDRRSKQIRLTQKGAELAARTVDRVLATEHKTLSALPEAEQEQFISLFRKYTELLHANMQIFEKR